MTAQIINLSERRAQKQAPIRMPKKAVAAIRAAQECLLMADDLMASAEAICIRAGVRLPPSRARSSHHKNETTN